MTDTAKDQERQRREEREAQRQALLAAEAQRVKDAW
jgi:hypothetical protein